MTTHLQTGVEGEQAAAWYLHHHQYKVLERNRRFGRDEIDIVAYDKRDEMMVFVEVKTRSATSCQYPIRTAVDRRKRRCLGRAINKWCIEHEYEGPGRIDIVCVSRGRIVEHIKEVGAIFL